MSGTSLDGLDLCYARFTKPADLSWEYEILKTDTIPYSSLWQDKLKNAFQLRAESLLELNSSYGFYLGEKTKEFRQSLGSNPVDLIASHGHTVFHQPQLGFTYQIGDGRAIKALNAVPVVYDFRSQDVLLGGQGAPLVPIGDQLLFPSYDACLNLGGFSNISFVQNEKRIAFDIGPLNIVLNHFANQLSKPYDAEGKIARKGQIDATILTQLNALDYYQKKGPKSLGLEWVVKTIFPLLSGLSPENAISTFTKHAAMQLSDVLKQNNLQKILITGGGAYNHYLLEQTEALSGKSLSLPSKELIEFKEALIFAFMGILRLRGENNVLSSVTGSSMDHSSGLLL